MNLEQLQRKLGYTFGDRRMLLQGLTHTSYGHEHLQERSVAHRDNERLEFLGDAILDVVVSDILLEMFPEANEGGLSKMRAAVVNEKTLATLASNLHLDQVVRLGKGEMRSNGQKKPSILSSTLEAVIAAIYLDGGFNAVYPVVRHLFVPLFANGKDVTAFYDHKTRLQELVQARWRVTPVYNLMSTTGPDHAKIFEIEIRMQDKILGVASGSSKKQAEQNAAHQAIEWIRREIEVEGGLT